MAKQMGFQGYASLLATLVAMGSATSRQLADANGWTRDAAKEFLRRMRKQSVIRVCDWIQENPGEHFSEVWTMDHCVEPARPPRYDGAPPQRYNRIRLPFRIHAFTFGLIMRALEDGHSAIDLANLIGIDRTASQKLISHMRKLKLIHVSSWIVPPYGPDIAVWKLGNKRWANHPPRPDRPTRQRLKRQSAAQHRGAVELDRIISCASFAQAI